MNISGKKSGINRADVKDIQLYNYSNVGRIDHVMKSVPN